MTLKLQFCGAAGMVTGSCYHIHSKDHDFLVDCGMFQGTKTIKQLNYGPFPFDPGKIGFVLLTHAHIDHSGLLPKLYKAGFSGPVYMTGGTKDLLSFMLPDSGYIQEMEVKYLNQRNARHGREQVSPIYSQKDAIACQKNFRALDYERWREIAPAIRARYWNAGHILGSASIEIEIGRTAKTQKAEKPLRLLFSGDLGPENKLFHPDPEAPCCFDYVFCESTYGGVSRPTSSPEQRRSTLARQVNKALKNNGMLLVPAFAVERTQELLVDLSSLQHAQKIPQVPVFLDSPMAIRATQVFQNHADRLEDINHHPGLLDNPNFHFTQSVDESKALNNIKSGAIILAASGMCDAGRIRHHLKNRLWQTNTTVMIVGHQEGGSLGHLLLEGRTEVKIQGQIIKVNAKIINLDVYSGHADGDELIEWVKARQPISQGLFITHGEKAKSQAMSEKLQESGFPDRLIHTPSLDEIVDLRRNKQGPQTLSSKPRISEKSLGSLDWHNDLAQLQIDLRKRFEQSADDRSRKALLRRLHKALNE